MRNFLELILMLFHFVLNQRLKARRSNSLRVMTWNLGERLNEELPHFVGLIKAVDPDIVCLNECRRNDGFDQIVEIARMAGYGHKFSQSIAGSNYLGRRSDKTIGIISKIPISDMSMLPPNWSGSPLAVFAVDGPYSDMEVTLSYRGVKHFVYSVRHSAYSLSMNRESLQWLEDRIRQHRTEARSRNEPIPNFIVAGDFNSPGAASGEPSRQVGFMSARPQPQHVLSFFLQAGLVDATQNLASDDEEWNGLMRPVCMVDVIAYSGDYDVLKAAHPKHGGLEFGRALSDHTYVFADLAPKTALNRRVFDLDVYYPPPFDFSLSRTNAIVSYDPQDRITATLLSTNWFDSFCTLQLKVPATISWRKEISLFARDGTLISTIFTDGSNRGPNTMRFLHADRAGMYLTLSKAQRSWLSVTSSVEKVRIYLQNIGRGQTIEFDWTQD